jgi:surface protein
MIDSEGFEKGGDSLCESRENIIDLLYDNKSFKGNDSLTITPSSIIKLIIYLPDSFNSLASFFYKVKCDKYSQYKTEIDSSNFDSSQIIKMKFTLSGCCSLISLNLSNFDTLNVLSMDIIFLGFISLISLDISNWQIWCVKEMKNLKMKKRMRWKGKLKKKIKKKKKEKEKVTEKQAENES